MDKVLEVLVLVEDEQHADDFAAIFGVSSIRTYHEFSLFEYVINKTERIYFYLITEISGSSDSVLRQLAPKVPLVLALIDDTASFSGSKLEMLYKGFLKNFKTPVLIFLAEKDENDPETLKEVLKINENETPLITYKNNSADFLHKLSGALQHVKLQIAKV